MDAGAGVPTQNVRVSATLKPVTGWVDLRVGTADMRDGRDGMVQKLRSAGRARAVGAFAVFDISGRYTLRAAGRLQPRAKRATVAGAMGKTNAAARHALKG